MIPATSKQIQAFNISLKKRGLMDQKASIVAGATGGRTESSKELSLDEAAALLKSLITVGNTPTTKMMGKLFAMAHEIGWITERTHVTDTGTTKKKDYSPLYSWVLKYGYRKVSLNDYTYDEFPKLLTQFEMGPYKHFLSPKKNKQ